MKFSSGNPVLFASALVLLCAFTLARAQTNPPASAVSSTNIVIRVTKSSFELREHVKIEVIQRPSALGPEDQRLFTELAVGKGTMVVISGTSTVHRAEMFPISAPGKTSDGLKFFHFVGIPGRSPVPNLAPGKYAIFVEMNNWKSNVEEFEVLKKK